MIKKLISIGIITILITGAILALSCKSGGNTITTQPVITSTGITAQLVFITEPDGAGAGEPFTTQPVIAIQDNQGNVITDSTDAVTVLITSNTGTDKAVLSGTRTVNAVEGIVKFTDLSLDLAGRNYSLTALSRGLKSTISHSFNVSPGDASRLIFYTDPSSTVAGGFFETQPIVLIEDKYGNLVTDSTAPVTVAITPDTGTAGAILSGNTTINAVNGVATFAYLSINVIGSEYTLTATSPGLSSATSREFYITAK